MKREKTLTAPVLLIIFNRPDTTQRVFNEICKAKPVKLYVAADGPRNVKGDEEKCEATRTVVKQVDWDCEVKLLFREKNLGCGVSASTATNWLFENETEGIILEDDTLPNQSFFWFCQDLLEKYRDDERIMMIGGDNFQDDNKRGDGSYYFSKYPQTWGWAGWRRAWRHYDFKMADFPNFRDQNQIRNVFEDTLVQEYWLRIFELTYEGKIDTWDYQWLFAIWRQNGLCITPNVNLVSNIGCGHEDASHIKDADNKLANVKTFSLERINHPTFMLQDKEADEYDSRHTFLIDSKSCRHVSFSITLKKIYQRMLRNLNSMSSPLTQAGPPAAKRGFGGDYSSWEEARKQSTGYNSEVIFEKVKNAALKVKNGETVYERDSVLFDKIQYSWPTLSGLLWIASMNDNRLNLIDFGGSLGTSYYQNRKFLKHLKALTWNVVEQERFVKCGKELFEGENLKFHFSMEDCIRKGNVPDVVLFSGVLEYIEKPYELLNRIFDFTVKYILIDRTPFSADGRNCITVQKVPPDIYDASFPYRFFSLEEFKDFFSRRYELIEEFDSFDKVDYPSFFKGFIFSCKE